MSLVIASDGLLQQSSPLAIATRGLLALLQPGPTPDDPAGMLPRLVVAQDEDEELLVILSLFAAHWRVGSPAPFDDPNNRESDQRK